MEPLTRLELTAYEAERLHETEKSVAAHSISVGAFVTRYGPQEALSEAAGLFLGLLDGLVADTNIRSGALGYGMLMADFRKEERQVSQTYQLQAHFLFDLYRAAIGERG